MHLSERMRKPGEAGCCCGRITYQLMASYWPTPNAIKNDPIVAEGMNRMAKVVFSRTLDQVSWNNTKLVKGDIPLEIRRMKKAPGEGMVILGSGSIVSQLAPEGLIDEYHLVVNPVVLGKGRTMFDGIKEKLNLRLTKTRILAVARSSCATSPRCKGEGTKLCQDDPLLTTPS